MVRTRTFEDSILDIPEGSIGRGRGQVPRGSAPPPAPVRLEQLLATQNDLMRRLVENDERCGAERQQPRHQEMDSSYSNFLATHPPIFADATDPLEADSWLYSTESKFGLLYCTEYQKTLYASGFWCLNDKTIKELMTFAKCETEKCLINYIEIIRCSRHMLCL
jgi:hypothetical protein